MAKFKKQINSLFPDEDTDARIFGNIEITYFASLLSDISCDIDTNYNNAILLETNDTYYKYFTGDTEKIFWVYKYGEI